MEITPSRRHSFQKKVLDFYVKRGRTLPWRQTTDPYNIWVSEVMLQQTQVERVLPYYSSWLEKFPTVEALARGESSEVLRLWSGLGYNSRALRMRQCAKEIIQRFSGEFPRSEADLRSLPGIGPYTARAILSFAHNEEVPVIDTNIRRIFIYVFSLPEKIPEGELESIARSLIPKGRSRDWHNALMDYGALELTSRKTGIKPRSQQSVFKGSDREVRGWVLKQLVRGERLRSSEVSKRFPEKETTKIISEMAAQGLIRKDGAQLFLP